ncbi:MAG: hypothetical protein GC136_00925 [Alphaproteobacteria bacterium]|nr:hypothetical protein [Alphaproteobacteria bacterium]
MEWSVKYEPWNKKKPWSVYKNFCEESILANSFVTRIEARQWAEREEQNHIHPSAIKNDIDEASLESFPASDPPAWTGTTVHSIEEKTLPKAS